MANIRQMTTHMARNEANVVVVTSAIDTRGASIGRFIDGAALVARPVNGVRCAALGGGVDLSGSSSATTTTVPQHPSPQINKAPAMDAICVWRVSLRPWLLGLSQ